MGSFRVGKTYSSFWRLTVPQTTVKRFNSLCNFALLPNSSASFPNVPDTAGSGITPRQLIP
jgi:hypothetical protein